MAFDFKNLISGELKVKTVLFTAPGYGIDKAEIDAVTVSEVTSTNRITVNPVEFGMAVTDNVVIQPDRIRLTGVISAYTSRLGGLISTGGVVDSAIETGESYFGGASKDTAGNHATQFFNMILELKNMTGRKTFDLYIYPKTYTNLVIENLSFTDSPALGEGIQFNMIAREIQIAIPNTNTTVNPKQGALTPPVNGGTKRPNIIDSLAGI